MIQQIVARRDGGEHLAYRARRRLRITGAHRSSADDWGRPRRLFRGTRAVGRIRNGDRKSTRLNSSHSQISYAVFCLKKKNNENMIDYLNAIEVINTYRMHLRKAITCQRYTIQVLHPSLL